MPKLVFTDSYEKKAKKFIKKHPELRDKYIKTLKFLQANPSHPALKLHKLTGKLSKLHSISINLSYRITIYFIIKKDTIIPIDIGTHDEVY
ncbi:type II toxin-antitoxin system YafQ family toxin [Patescibacteria group bacterium]